MRTTDPLLDGPVESVRSACASKRIEDGGFVVVITLERATSEATELRVAFPHLDPVTVVIGDTRDVDDASLVTLGPEVAQDWGSEAGLTGHMHGVEEPQCAEYHSSCAQHSHLHLEGFGADSVMRARNRPGLDDPLLSFTTGGEMDEPDVGDGAVSFRTSDIVAVTVAAAPVAPSPGTSEVQEGETLLEIAAKLGLPLVAENPDLIEAGETLAVPGQTHVV
jgi:LysM repeat protein